MGRKKVCMIVQDKMVKGGIAAVISGYYGSILEEKYQMTYVESYKDGGKLTKLIKGVQGYLKFAKILMFEHPDMVHIHSSFGPSFYRKLPFIYMASIAKIPIVNHIHGADFDEFYLNASEKKRKLISKVYKKCAKLIALSAEWKDRLSLIVPSEKIEIIENYSVLNTGAFEERKQRNSNHTVLFLGELGRRKGCYDIPAVIKKVVKEVPDARFVLCGAGSEEDEKAINGMIEELGITENVEFPGWVRSEKKDQILKKADVFFLPSYNEGMPMSILDAMGYGLPIVSTDVGGIPKIVHNDENGYCCNAGDVDNMASILIRILTDNDLQLKLGQKSIDIIKESYSLDHHLELLINVYQGEVND